jgi:urease accessory protein
MERSVRIVLPATFALAATPAFAHIGVGETTGFAAGLQHPLSGLDHVLAMVAVGLWAALKGGRAQWAWPAAFVGVMLIGGVLGAAHVPIPLVEPGILASVVALGLLVALAVDVPVWAGAMIVGAFAVFHGHAHGTEVPVAAGGIAYFAAFAAATVALHGVGIAFGNGLGLRFRSLARLAGAASAAAGVGLIAGVL